MRTVTLIVIMAAWLATVGVCVDLTGQRDRALTRADEAERDLQQARSEALICQRSAVIAQEQARRLASRPEPTCPSIGERLLGALGGGDDAAR